MNINLIILIILIVLVIILLKYKKYKDNFTPVKISEDDLPKFTKIINESNDNKYVKNLRDVLIINKLKVNDVEIKKLILDIRYPIGCYYVQYPQNNIDIHDDEDIPINDIDTMLPKAKSPAILFGGKWEEQFKGDAVFFRTGGKLSDNGRLNGIQTSAMKKIDGCTSIAQTNIWNPGWGSQGILEEVKTQDDIATDGKKTLGGIIAAAVVAAVLILAAVVIAVGTVGLGSGASATLMVAGVMVANAAVVTTTVAAANAIAIALIISVGLAVAIYGSLRVNNYINSLNYLYYGPVAKPGDPADKSRGKICADRGEGPGHQNLMDPSLQSPVSAYELRPRNRIIKVWKRVA